MLGSAIIAFGTHIHADANIPEGGIIGLALIIENFTGLSYIAINLVINAVFCILAWRLMGTKYMFNVAVATFSFSFFSSIFSKVIPMDIFFNPETEKHYLLLAALVGSIIRGVYKDAFLAELIELAKEKGSKLNKNDFMSIQAFSR